MRSLSFKIAVIFIWGSVLVACNDNASVAVNERVDEQETTTTDENLDSVEESTSVMTPAPTDIYNALLNTGIDQCDSTTQCRQQYPAATDCKNSRSTNSVCMCEDVSCDSLVNQAPIDQCDTTSQCRATWDNATDCKESRSESSVCLCGTQRCDNQPQTVAAPEIPGCQVFDITPYLKNYVAQMRVGDPNSQFDLNKLDANYPQMREWLKAGVRGGIPLLHNLQIKRIVNGGNETDINRAINEVAECGGGTVLLSDGVYQIHGQIKMKSNVSLLGETRKGTVAEIHMENSSAFLFGEDVRYSGIYRMTIRGSWGTPRFNWNVGQSDGGAVKNNELPGNSNVSVLFKGAFDSWLDGVDIINSADFPVRSNAKHITFRDLNVDGVHNKQGGFHGYFIFMNSHNLMTQSKVTHLRHISLQGDNVRYNVLYDNDLRQEISFHSNDDGDNLIENNRITLPADMTPIYHAIMGPWSIQHKVSKRDNYLYRNTTLERNNNNARFWSNNSNIYRGPNAIKVRDPFPANRLLPVGRTLYPVMIEN